MHNCRSKHRSRHHSSHRRHPCRMTSQLNQSSSLTQIMFEHRSCKSGSCRQLSHCPTTVFIVDFTSKSKKLEDLFDTSQHVITRNSSPSRARSPRCRLCCCRGRCDRICTAVERSPAVRAPIASGRFSCRRCLQATQCRGHRLPESKHLESVKRNSQLYAVGTR